MTEFENLLRSTIKHYNDGNMQAFANDAISIYDAQHACCELLKTNHHYLLGTIFSYMAEMYKFKPNIYLTLVESSIYCFSKTIMQNGDSVERRNAAKRMVLLIDGNEVAMLNIVNRFLETDCTIDYNAYEVNKMIGVFCVYTASKLGWQSSLSEKENNKYNNIIKGNKYPLGISILNPWSSEKKIFELFVKFIGDIVGYPDNRRMAYSWQCGV